MITLFSDPHLGIQRQAHTTADSKKRLNQAVFKHAMLASVGDNAICLADLFDKDSNDEATILQGMRVAAQCEVVLAGNHDLPNREGKTSSLQLINEAMGETSTVVIAPLHEAEVTRGSVGDVNVTIIPHLSTQQLFDQAVDDACSESIGGLLLTHCNYDNGFAQDDASLNLSKGQAERLLEHYQMILSGHEHNYSEHFGGRLVMVGNTFPTSFGDISDKFVWTFDQKAGLTKEQIWSKDKHYRRIEVSDDLELDDNLLEVQFLDIDGRINPDKGPELAEFIQSLWEGFGALLMVRNNVTYTTDSQLTSASEGARIHDLPKQIGDDLANTDLKPLWDAYSKDI